MAVNTIYRFWDFNGVKGEHLVLFSSNGNEFLHTEERLGEDIMDGNRVFASTRLAAYLIKANETGGCQISYLTIMEKTGVPDYLFRKLASSVFGTAFDTIVGKVNELAGRQ